MTFQQQQRYKRIFGYRVATRNADVKIGGYVYTTNHDRQNKLHSKAIGPFVVVDADADASTFVIVIDGEEKRVSSDYVTPARPTTADTVLHPLLDGLDQRKSPPATADEYVIDKLPGLRQTGDSYSAKVRWFDYGSKDDTWESPGEPPPHPGGAFPSTEEEACAGVRVANGNTTKSPTSRAHNCGQHRPGPHVDTNDPTCPCYRRQSCPCQCLLDRVTYCHRS